VAEGFIMHGQFRVGQAETVADAIRSRLTHPEG
jgi:hypothetical protein